jgi:hypothetical protein
MLGAIIFWLISFCVIGAILILLGVGISFALAKFIPGVDFKSGIIAGAIFSIGIVHFFLRFVKTFNAYGETPGDEGVEPEKSFFEVPRDLWRVPRTRRKRR